MMSFMNRDKLRAKAKNKAKEIGVDSPTVMRLYAMERFLARLEQSSMHEDAVIKGGVLLGSLFGLESRTTKDLDITIRGRAGETEAAKEALSQIAAIELGDGISFQVGEPEIIMQQRSFPGFRLPVQAICGRLKVPFAMELSFGDVITPGPVLVKAFSVFGDSDISVYAYPIETVIAEKLNAVLSLGVENTRTRDFYDLAEIRKRYWCEIDKEGLRKACLATMKQRGTSGLLKNWRDAIDRVAHSPIQKQYWQRYAEANSFAKEYDFDQCMQSIYDLAEAIFDQCGKELFRR